jgi:hypothetical protein
MPVWPIFWDAMTNACDQLHIEVVNDEVIVTLPLTSYNVTYYRPENARYVLATKFTDRDDPLAGCHCSPSRPMVGPWHAARRGGVMYVNARRCSSLSKVLMFDA